MSRQVDERVVSMQFDNKHFESNVQTSMSTLDKLKAKLNLSGASKGLENVNAAANKVNMSGLSKGVETIQSRFSAMEVIGVTALANITNSAVNAGKRIVSSLTVEPVKMGFNEYELKMDSVKTIMASTGESVETVNKYLNELNEYSDQTIYSFADMTQNIGKFTNAGVKLEDAVLAIKGISNEAAVSGANANEASRAMYNFAQALSSGHVKLIDWKSIELANMATVEFKQHLLDAAVSAGTLKKSSDGMYTTLKGNTLSATKNFNDTLQDQWMTSEVLISTLKEYSDETTEIGKKAFASAQDVTKLSQMFDVLKETAQSGWARSWEIIFGDIEKAKALFTPLTNFFSSIIDGMSDWRNTILEKVFGSDFSPLGKLADKLNGITEKTKGTVDSMKDLGDIVDRVIRGEFGNQGDEGDRNYRAKRLTEAGYDYATVQNAVNEKLGCSVRLTSKLTEAQKGLNDEQSKTIEELLALSDAELKNLGFTEDEIAALRELQKQSEKTGISVTDLLKDMDQLSGRTLLINAFKNVGKSLVDVFKAMGDAWNEIFPNTGDNIARALYNAIAAFHNFSTRLKVSDETADKWKRTFKGVFAILKIIGTLIGGPIKIAFKILVKVLKLFNVDILDITASVGDAIVAFSDWLDKVLNIDAAAEWLAAHLKTAAKVVRDWFKVLKDSPMIQAMGEYLVKAGIALRDWFIGLKDTKLFKTLINYFTETGSAIRNWFVGLKDADNIGSYIIQGLVNGLKHGIKIVWSIITTLGKTILNAIKEILGIHSPSTEFFEIGKNIIQGLFNGISATIKTVFELLVTIGSKLIEIIENLDIGSIFTMVVGSTMMIAFVKIANALDKLTNPLEGLGDLFIEASKTFKTFRKSLSLGVKAYAIKTIAIAIAILAGSIALLTLLDQKKMWSAVGAIAALMAMLAGLAFVVGRFGPKEGVALGNIALSLIGISSAVLLISFALKNLAGIKSGKMVQATDALKVILVSLVAAMAVFGKSGKTVANAGSNFIKLSIALLIMVAVVKQLGKMSPEALKTGLIAITGFTAIIIALIAATKFLSGSTNVGKIGQTIFKVSTALLMLLIVAKIAAKMEPDELKRGTIAVAAFSAIVVGLMAATRLVTGSTNVSKIGGAILGVSAALLIMMITAKMAAKMEPADLLKGGLAVAAFGGIVVGLMAATKLITGSKNIDKIGRAILSISVSIGILAMIAALLSLMDTAALAKGVIAVGLLAGMMAILVAVTKNAKNCTGTIAALTASIAVLALAIGLLSLLDPTKLIAPTLAMSALLGMFILVMKSTKDVKKSMGTLIVLTSAIAVMAGALYLVGKIPVKNALAAAGALSILMGVLVGVLYIINKHVKVGKDAFLAIAGLLALCAPLLALVLILKSMDGLQNVLQNALALAGLATILTLLLIPLKLVGSNVASALLGVVGLTALAVSLVALIGVLILMNQVKNAEKNADILGKFATILTLMLIPLTIVGLLYTATGGMAMLGIAGLLALCVPLIALIGVLAIMENVKGAEANTKILSKFLTVITGVLVTLAIVGPLALVGVTAMTALTSLMVAVAALAVGIGALVERFPVIQSFLDTGISLFIQLADGIGRMLGAFVGGIADQIASVLPSIGLSLSQFITNAMPFIEGIKMLDSKATEGAMSLVKVVLAITAANVIEGIASWLTGENSISKFASELPVLGEGLRRFSISIAGMDAEAVKTAADAAKSIADMASVIPKEGGVAAWFAGENSISKFAGELPKLGNGLRLFSLSIAGMDAEAVKTAADAAKSIADMASVIPNEGGVAAWFAGENSISSFAGQLPMLGKGLRDFSVSTSGLRCEAVKAAADAAKSIADMASVIPKEGGVAAWFAGENSISKFASQFGILGVGLQSFYGSVTGIDVNTVYAGVDAAIAIADLTEHIPEADGVKQWFTGEASISSFAEQLPVLGEGLFDFYDSLGGMQPERIKAAATACKAIAHMLSYAPSDEEKYEIVSDGMAAVGEGVANFLSSVSKYTSDKVEAAQLYISKVVRMFSGLYGIKWDTLTKLGESLKNLATEGILGIAEAYSSDEPVEAASDAAKRIMTAFINALKETQPAVETQAKALSEAAVSGVTDWCHVEEATTAGENVANGFAIGISNGVFRATAAGRALAQATLAAVKAVLDVNSPSKEMYKIGDFTGQGFVNALNDYVNVAYASSFEVGSSAMSGLKDAISRITDVVNNGIDTQPVIRPVLDLTDVRSGAGAIGGMFNGRTLSVNARSAGVISASMSEFQNRRNSNEVVSSIKDLRKDISNMPRNTYQINGITYDDGSNVSDAVKVLVRAANIERRR